MTTFYAQGSPQTDLTHTDLRAALVETFKNWSRGGRCWPAARFHPGQQHGRPLCSMAYDYFGDRLTDVMPALGTHAAMPDWQLDRMFAGVPKGLFRVHDWRNDVVTIGQVPAEFVAEATEGIYRKPWPRNSIGWCGRADTT